MEFENRRVLITGVGARNGLGFAVAQALVAAGANVVITSLSDRAQLRSQELPKTHALCGDLTTADFAAELVDFTVSKIGGLDVVINNAGMTSIDSKMQENGESNHILQMTLDAWNRAISRNLTSAFLLTQAAIPELRRSGSGRVIAVSSVTGAVMAMQNEVAYAAAKAGMLGLIRSVAVDEARYGITANAVSPGWIATDSQTALEVAQGLSTPMGRSGTAAEIASAVLWLSSVGASYITGQNLVVDGGNSIAEERA